MATRGLEVGRALRDLIATGAYAPGSRLNENELAIALKVSRTPVRSALSTLAAEGLLVYRPNSGYSVRPFSSRDIEEIYAVRAELDGMAARLAAFKGLSDQQRGAHHRLLQESGELIAQDRWDDDVCQRWRQVNSAFHAVIHEAANNAYLVQAIHQTDEIPFFALIRFKWYDKEMLRRSHEEHVEISDAILNRQPSRAESLESEHVYRSGRRLVANWRRIEEQIRRGKCFESAVLSDAA
ncbi:MAG: GntR family transcriptional regulator [Roseinatronobacter sp.]|nr:GntR family transcriptional regulator [Roseinatronobacter sp.]